MTFIRAVQWVAVVITGWSLSLRWGDEIAAGKRGKPEAADGDDVAIALVETEHVLLLDIGQDVDAPAQQRLAIRIGARARRQARR